MVECGLTCRMPLEALASGPHSGRLLVSVAQTLDSHSCVVCMAFAAGFTTIWDQTTSNQSTVNLVSLLTLLVLLACWKWSSSWTTGGNALQEKEQRPGSCVDMVLEFALPVFMTSSLPCPQILNGAVAQSAGAHATTRWPQYTPILTTEKPFQAKTLQSDLK